MKNFTIQMKYIEELDSVFPVKVYQYKEPKLSEKTFRVTYKNPVKSRVRNTHFRNLDIRFRDTSSHSLQRVSA